MMKKIVLMGQGSITSKIAGYLSSNNIVFELVTLDDSSRKINSNISLPKKYNSQYLTKDSLKEYLLSIKEKCLIISAANRYIFPKEVVSKNNLEIINYHSSLLPKHPGRNAEAWAIYNGDKYGGITWHFVNEEIDNGRVIKQEKVEITDGITAFSLLNIYNNLAYEVFKLIFPSLIGEINVADYYELEQIQKPNYSWKKPNDGILQLDSSGEEISRTIRAFDYSILNILGNLKFRLDGKDYKIKSYRIFKDNYLKNREDFIYKHTQTDLYLKKDSYLFFILIDK